MRFPIILLFFGLLAFSCKKNAVIITPYHHDTLSATIDGTTPSNFVPKTIGVLYWPSNGYTPPYVSIVAIEENGRELVLEMDEYDGTKTSFNNDNQIGHFASFGLKDYNRVVDSVHNSVSGAINIDSFDKTTYKNGEVITGTFQFAVDDSTGKFSIRDGHFSVFFSR